MNARHRHMRGLSLIEIMIALLIGSLLILGLVQVFGASRTAYQMSEGMARVQENARFAMDFLQRDIRMAGHFGCVSDQAHAQSDGALEAHFEGVVPGDGHPLDFSVSIQGYEAPGTAPGSTLQIGVAGSPPPVPDAISTLTPGPVPGSDILVLRYLRNEGAPVTGIAVGGSGTEEILTLANDRWEALTVDGVPTPTLFGIADCTYVDVFAGSSPGGTGVVDVTATPPAALPTNLIGRYTPQPSGQTMLYRAESLVYYVGESSGGEPSLYRARYNGATSAYDAPEELVQGIENMQLIFGLDRADLSAGPPSGYIDTVGVADGGWGVAQWRGVGMVQVGLLARSPDPAASEQAGERSVAGVVFTAPASNDNLFRAGYETTIALRNRLYGN